MKKLYLFLLAMCLIGTACKEDKPQEIEKICNVDNPLTDLPWLKAKIDEINSLVQDTIKRRFVDIYQCEYNNGETGFLINEGFTHPFYSCNGDIICKLGGLTEESCPELNIVSYKLIWEAIKLQGRKWKLAGMVDSETGVLTQLEPKDCTECYTLTFDTDSTAIPRGSNAILEKLDVLHLNPVSILDAMLHCEHYYKDGRQYCDLNYFRGGLKLAYAYEATSDELKLFYSGFYNVKAGYLLFKPFKQ
jgi:hypothetical protein